MTAPMFNHQRLRRSFIGVSGLFMLGIPLTLLANILLARTLSVAEFGAFGFVISLATVLSIPVSAGLPMLLTREIAGYVQSKNWRSYRGLVLSAYRWLLMVSALIGVGLLLWFLLASDAIETQLLIAFLLVPFFGLNGIRNGILKGLGRPVLAELPTQAVQPVLTILGFMGLAGLGLATATNALWCYLFVMAVVFGIASAILWRVQPGAVRGVTSDLDDMPRWRKAILPFAMMNGALMLSSQIAVLLPGFLGHEEVVAQFRVAERGAQLIAFPLTFINSILGPYFVQALQSNNKGELRGITRYSARLTLMVSFPAGLILIVFGRTLIGWTFGEAYAAQSYIPMVILIGAQISSVALGNGGILLAMGGHEKQTLYGLLLMLAVISLASLLLIGPFGAIGAAIAAAGGIITAQTYVYVAVRRRFNVSPGII